MTDEFNVDVTPVAERPRRGRSPKEPKPPKGPEPELAKSRTVVTHKARLKEKDAIRNRMMGD